MAPTDHMLHRLHVLGWSIGDVAFRDPQTGRGFWLVTGTRGEHVISASRAVAIGKALGDRFSESEVSPERWVTPLASRLREDPRSLDMVKPGVTIAAATRLDRLHPQSQREKTGSLSNTRRRWTFSFRATFLLSSLSSAR